MRRRRTRATTRILGSFRRCRTGFVLLSCGRGKCVAVSCLVAFRETSSRLRVLIASLLILRGSDEVTVQPVFSIPKAWLESEMWLGSDMYERTELLPEGLLVTVCLFVRPTDTALSD